MKDENETEQELERAFPQFLALSPTPVPEWSQVSGGIRVTVVTMRYSDVVVIIVISSG